MVCNCEFLFFFKFTWSCIVGICQTLPFPGLYHPVFFLLLGVEAHQVFLPLVAQDNYFQVLGPETKTPIAIDPKHLVLIQ